MPFIRGGRGVASGREKKGRPPITFASGEKGGGQRLEFKKDAEGGKKTSRRTGSILHLSKRKDRPRVCQHKSQREKKKNPSSRALEKKRHIREPGKNGPAPDRSTEGKAKCKEGGEKLLFGQKEGGPAFSIEGEKRARGYSARWQGKGDPKTMRGGGGCSHRSKKGARPGSAEKKKG